MLVSRLLTNQLSYLLLRQHNIWTTGLSTRFIDMAARKAAAAIKKEHASTTSPRRRSARVTGGKTDDQDHDAAAIKKDARKANVGVKRAASGEGKAAKRVKTEVKHEDTDDLKSPLKSADKAVKEEAENESDEFSEDDASEVESDFSDEEVDTKKSKKTGTKASKSSARKNGKPASSTPKSTSKNASNATKTSPGDKEAALQAKKLKSYSQFSKASPFPDFPHPTAEEAKLAHKILSSLHGERVRPEKVVARNDRAGCGDSPSVLDALVRTILSQNTSDKNSTRAKLSMNKVYGGSDEWEAIYEGGQAKLQEAIKCGGLSAVKSKVIMSILEQVKERYGKFSLDHLFDKTDEEAMSELIGYKGVGPKTASCVLLFCLQRESFAVDTHVYRIAGLLGWRPKSATRDQTHAHLEVMIPDEDKYGLHILMVGHGKKCDECKAGGRSVGKCELRKAFRKGKLEGEAGEDIKEEEEEIVKEEEEDDGDDKENVKEEEWESGQEDYVHGMQSGKSKASNKKKTKGRK